MKIATALKASAFAAVLGFACLLPPTVHAQDEVTPDFYQLSNTETTAAQATQFAGATTANADFAGKFSLPYDVKCSGKNLKAGQYVLSVKAEGTSRVVTIHGSGANVNVAARVVPANQAASRSALFVCNSNEGRRLEAIYVAALNATLYLETSASHGVMEQLPIS